MPSLAHACALKPLTCNHRPQQALPATSDSVRSMSACERVTSPNPMRRMRLSSADQAGPGARGSAAPRAGLCSAYVILPAARGDPADPPRAPLQKASTYSGEWTTQRSSREGRAGGTCTCRDGGPRGMCRRVAKLPGENGEHKAR